LAGVTLIRPRRFGDERGWFSETYSRRAAAAQGITEEFVQDNHSLSGQKGTLRGLHFQRPPHAQAKLVRCTRGRIMDYAVDVRRGSPTYGKWVAAELSGENGAQLYVPVGFAHAFLTLEPDCEVMYKVSDYYAPDCDGGIRFDDPEIGITWPIPAESFVLSDKDRKLPRLAEFDSPFTYDGEPLPPKLD
jgi:dTDP-4-dehydrorhamnose 3,5-epimerase